MNAHQKLPSRSKRNRSNTAEAQPSGGNARERRLGLVARAAALRGATGIVDEDALLTLADLGFTPDTVQCLHLVPLAHVAWVEGGMSRRERGIIEDLAGLRGIRYPSPAFKALAEWLERPLPPGFFERCLEVIATSLDAMPDRMRHETVRSILSHGARVAAASREPTAGRDRIAGGEHDVLAYIVETLDRSRTA